jgi:DMSO/TMAO reductase YedYZ heme-binding membrane subunit
VIEGTSAPSRGLRVGYLLGVAALAGAIVIGTLGMFGTGEEGLRLANRYLARLAFYLFLPAYAASALHQLWRSPATKWMMRERRSLGLGYAVAQLAHLGTILAALSASEEPFVFDVGILFGGTAFALLVAMTATSSDAAQRRLGMRAWKRLHIVGIHFIWFIYLASYQGNVVEEGTLWGWIGLVLVIGALLLRVAARLSRRRSLTVATPAEA